MDEYWGNGGQIHQQYPTGMSLTLGNIGWWTETIPYAEMLKSNKLVNKVCKESVAEKVIKNGDRICINYNPKECSKVLKRSLVGIFEARIGETPTLSEIRRWAYRLRKQADELNMRWEMDTSCLSLKSPT